MSQRGLAHDELSNRLGLLLGNVVHAEIGLPPKSKEFLICNFRLGVLTSNGWITHPQQQTSL